MPTMIIHKFRKLSFWFLLLFGIGLMGCRDEAAMVTTTPPPTINATPNPIATSLPTPTAHPTQAPPPTATTTATATPRPTASLAVPPKWNAAANEAIAQLQSSPHWQWQLAETEDAATIRLVPGESNVIWQRPLTFVVPFTTNWENSDFAYAQDILANGHELVQVLPWDELSPNMKALRVDGRHPTDADYPFQTSWSLVAEPGYETAVAELSPILQNQLAEPIISLTAVGDLMLARRLGHFIKQGDLAYPFAHFSDQLQAADLTLGNLESALGDVGQPENKRYPFQSPPAAARSLAQAGFDIVSLANNHAMDYGPDALQQAISLLHEQGVAPIGAGSDRNDAYQPYLTEINGLRLAFLGYVNVPVEASTGFDTQSWTASQNAPGLAWAEPEIVHADVTAVARQVDLVIVVLHSGFEYIEEPSEPQVAIAQAAIDAGAALVIGHHAHILQGIHFYNDGVIVYGLGNFAFQIEGDPETAVLNVWLDKNGVRQLELIPAIVQESGQPRPATPQEAEKILQRVHFLTTILNSQ